MATVRDIMSLPVFSESQVSAGHEGLDRVVTGATVMEVPDIDQWVRPGELVLTTLFAVHEDPNAIANIIERLDRQQCAALAVKTRRYLTAVPDIMKEAANLRHFPLIELSESVSHSTALESILMRLLSERSWLADQAANKWYELVQVALAHPEGSLGNVLDATSRVLGGNPVALMRGSRIVAVSNGPFGDVLEIGDDLGGLKWEPLEPPQEGLTGFWVSAGAYRSQLIRMFRYAPEARESLGLLLCEVGHTVTTHHLAACRYAFGVTALEFLRRETAHVIENRYRASFLRSILAGELGAEADIVAHARQIGWNLEAVPSTMVVADPILRAIRSSPVSGRHRVDDLSTRLSMALPVLGWHGIVCPLGESVVMLTQNQDSALTESRIAQLLLSARISRDSVRVGIGRPYPLAELGRSFREAEAAVDFLKWTESTGAIHFNSLGANRLLLALKGSPELGSFVADTLGAIRDYDRHHNALLLDTLVAFYQHGANIPATAKYLHVHYNTVVNRIRQIETLVGGSVRDPDRALSLQLALRALQVHQWGTR